MSFSTLHPSACFQVLLENRLQHRVKFAMPHEQLLALAILAFVGSFAPGPNNVIATMTGANHDFRAVLPHVLGVPSRFATMLIADCAGVAALLLTYPYTAALIKWAGIAYLLFIAWQLAQRHPHATRKDSNSTGLKPLSFWQSAAFRYANPKAWMLVAATAGSFMASNATVASIAIIVIVFFDRCHRQSCHLGLGGRCAAKLAWHRLENANLQTSRWACSSPPPQHGWRYYEGHAITSPGNRRQILLALVWLIFSFIRSGYRFCRQVFFASNVLPRTCLTPQHNFVLVFVLAQRHVNHG